MTARKTVSTFAPETKYFDTNIGQQVDYATDWATANVACANRINEDGTAITAYTASPLIPSAVGSGYGQVVGTKYILKQIRFRGVLNPAIVQDAADVASPVTVRLMLIRDKQPNGAQALPSSILTDWGNALQNQFSFMAMGAGSAGRFEILKDKTYILQPAMSAPDGTNTSSNIAQSKTVSMTWKSARGVLVQIKGSGGPAVASLANENFYLVAHSSQQVPNVYLYGSCRAYYVD